MLFYFSSFLIHINSSYTCYLKLSGSIKYIWYFAINAIFAFYCLKSMIHSVQLTSAFPIFRKNILKTPCCEIFVIRKISLNHRVWRVILLISKQAITISCVLICCVLIVAKPYEVSKILKDNCAEYPRDKLASFLELIKAKTSPLPLFTLTL